MPGQLGASLEQLLEEALVVGADGSLREALLARSGLPGARMNLGLVDRFAAAVAELVRRSEPPVDALERLLDGWAALSPADAPGDQPAVILPSAAVVSYGAVGAARPEWWPDEIAKLRRAAADSRWRVREMVAGALQRLLEADWGRTVGELGHWADDDDPLVVRAAAAGVAEPRLLGPPDHAVAALEVQRSAVAALVAVPDDRRRDDPVRVLRQALGYTISVAVAAGADFSLLDELAASGDSDLRWIVRESLKKKRLAPWPEDVDRLRVTLTR